MVDHQLCGDWVRHVSLWNSVSKNLCNNFPVLQEVWIFFSVFLRFKWKAKPTNAKSYIWHAVPVPSTSCWSVNFFFALLVSLEVIMLFNVHCFTDLDREWTKLYTTHLSHKNQAIEVSLRTFTTICTITQVSWYSCEGMAPSISEIRRSNGSKWRDKLVVQKPSGELREKFNSRRNRRVWYIYRKWSSDYPSSSWTQGFVNTPTRSFHLTDTRHFNIGFSVGWWELRRCWKFARFC